MMLCASALDVLSVHLPAAGLPEDLLQELQLQQQQNTVLTEELGELMFSGIESDSAQHSAATLLELHDLQQQYMPQLASFAGRVVAQLPLRWACNHPGCGNLGGASELALVGGKGCVCSGCRSAR
jgi:hypothetical protein